MNKFVLSCIVLLVSFIVVSSLYEGTTTTDHTQESQISDTSKDTYEKDFINIYSNYLDNLEESNIKYTFIHINNDDVPELVYALNTGTNSGVNVCILENNKVYELGNFGCYGGFEYVPCQSIVNDNYNAKGILANRVYQIKHLEALLIDEYRMTLLCDDNGNGYMKYEIDNKEVSQEEFEQVDNKYDFIALKYDDMFFYDRTQGLIYHE